METYRRGHLDEWKLNKFPGRTGAPCFGISSCQKENHLCC